MRKKPKFLLKCLKGTWDLSHCRRTRVSRLRHGGLESSLFSHHVPASTNVLSIFGHVVAVDVLHEYMEYISEVVDTSQDAFAHIDSTVLNLARLNAVISTVIYCVKIMMSIRLVVIPGSTTLIHSHHSYQLPSASSLEPLQHLCLNGVQKSLKFHLFIFRLESPLYRIRPFEK